jgi:hypothetical protein
LGHAAKVSCCDDVIEWFAAQKMTGDLSCADNKESIVSHSMGSLTTPTKTKMMLLVSIWFIGA